MNDYFEWKAKELLAGELSTASITAEALAEILRDAVGGFLSAERDPERGKEQRHRASDWVNRSTAQARSEQRPITPEELVVVRAAKNHVGGTGQTADPDSWRKLELAVGRLPW
jgi:hypothetical protein